MALFCPFLTLRSNEKETQQILLQNYGKQYKNTFKKIVWMDLVRMGEKAIAHL